VTAALDVLVLGGTSWLGGAVARSVLEAGHRVTCLARGEAGTVPPGATWVRADRSAAGAYDQVAGRAWDGVVDVSWQPAFVRSALEALAPTARHWVYVSSTSAYVREDLPGTDETAEVHRPFAEDGPVDRETYGPAKVACELLCRDALGDEHVLVARAGLIGGHGDRSDRLGYWPARVARARDDEPVLVPPRDGPVQVVDVEDLSEWLVRCVEQRTSGVLNAVGEPAHVDAVLEASVAAAGVSPRFVEASHAWLAAHGVAPWAGPGSLPLWLPQPEYAGHAARSGAAARAAGLLLRPLAETVGAALRHERSLGLDRDRSAGLEPAREAELLRLLDA
jgi:2'-hydroxyisoflavone reductase